MDILNFSRDSNVKGILNIDLVNQQTFKRSEVLRILQFFLTNFKGKKKENEKEKVEELKIMFEEIEQIMRNQSYNMIMFLDLFKEVD